MKIHTVELEDLKKFELKHKVLFSMSSKEQKALYCTLNKMYEVWHFGELKLKTSKPDQAIKFYNSLTFKTSH